jgi:DNA polymerase III epsilon subunit-like protein
MYLIFDLETTGLVQCEKFNVYPDFRDLLKYDNARIVQIAWIVINDAYEIIEKKNYIVKRDNFSIQNSSFHGITNEISDVEGADFDIVMADFSRSLSKCKVIVAHNILFDINVLTSSLFRYDLYNIFLLVCDKMRFCTAYESMDVIKLKMPYGANHFKFPSLQELYTFYFGKKIKNAHNAMADTLACMRCFIALVQDPRYLKQYGAIQDEKK